MNYEVETQLSVSLANEPGQIAQISDLLSANDITLRAVSIAEDRDTGTFRFIPCDQSSAIQVLDAKRYSVKEENVLSIRLKDSKGMLAEVTKALAASGINIDYVYASVDSDGANSRLIIKVSNIPLATRLLNELFAVA